MAIRQRLIIMSGLIALVCLIGLLYEGWQWNQTRLYNAAIVEGNFAEAGDQNDQPRALFAKAYAQQQQGNFQEARVIYGMIENVGDQQLRLNVLFNMANTYLQQAATLDLKTEADRAMPLVELAKTSYRKLLSIDSHHWDAKYNLERALQLLPDAGKFISNKSEGLRGAIRTVITSDTEGNLP